MSWSTWSVPVHGGLIGGITNAGTGRDLLFVPGVGMPAQAWWAVMEDLADYRAVAMDLRGHAHSVSAPVQDGTRSWRDILTVVERLNLRRPVVVGHDTGGFLALAAAADRPDLLSAVVTLDAGLMDAPRIEVQSILEFAHSDEVIDTLADRFGLGLVFGSRQEVDDFVSGHRAALARDWLASDLPGDISEVLRASVVEGPDGTWLRTPTRQTMRAAWTVDIDARYYPSTELYDQVDVPIHIVEPEDGLSVMPAEAARRLLERRPNVRIHAIDGGHLAYFSEASTVADVVREAVEDAPLDPPDGRGTVTGHGERGYVAGHPK